MGYFLIKMGIFVIGGLIGYWIGCWLDDRS